MKNNLWFWVTFFCFTIDQIIKNLMTLGLIGEMKLNSWISLSVVYNKGIAFSLGYGYGLLISAVALLIFLYFLFNNVWWWQQNTISQIAVALVLSGSLSNIVDRLRFGGGVVDYIDVSFYSVFNLGDVFIFLGLLLLVWYYWKYDNVT